MPRSRRNDRSFGDEVFNLAIPELNVGSTYIFWIIFGKGFNFQINLRTFEYIYVSFDSSSWNIFYFRIFCGQFLEDEPIQPQNNFCAVHL